MKNNKGITLIALVVTIIVLLILAGVSIAMLTGQNGILKKAGDAKTASTAGNLDEAVKIVVGNRMTNDLGWTKIGQSTDNAATEATALETDIKAVNSTFKSVSATIVSGKHVFKITADDQTVYLDGDTGAVSTTEPTV